MNCHELISFICCIQLSELVHLAHTSYWEVNSISSVFLYMQHITIRVCMYSHQEANRKGMLTKQ